MLPAGISLILNDAIYSCRTNPPADWPEAAYRLIVRQDLAAQCCDSKQMSGAGSSSNMCSDLPVTSNASDANKKTAATRVAECEQDDGMETMDMEVCTYLQFLPLRRA